MLRGLPDYPKDADAALAAFPYNSSSRVLREATPRRLHKTTSAQVA